MCVWRLPYNDASACRWWGWWVVDGRVTSNRVSHAFIQSHHHLLEQKHQSRIKHSGRCFLQKTRLNIPLKEKQLPEYTASTDRLFESLDIIYCLLFKILLIVIENRKPIFSINRKIFFGNRLRSGIKPGSSITRFRFCTP